MRTNSERLPILRYCDGVSRKQSRNARVKLSCVSYPDASAMSSTESRVLTSCSNARANRRERM
ncbi:hypothetical protein D3C71_1861690 [compost metagenome]